MTIYRPLTARTRLGEADVPASATQMDRLGLYFSEKLIESPRPRSEPLHPATSCRRPLPSQQPVLR